MPPAYSLPQKSAFMKKSLFSFIAVAILFAAATVSRSQQLIPFDLIQTDGLITLTDVNSTTDATVHPVALRAMQSGEKKGEFTNVSYTFAPNVRKMPALKSNIRLARDGVAQVSTFIPHPDTIYVDADENSDLVFRAMPLAGNEMALLRPSFSSVFSDFSIEEQEVKLTLANTTECAVQNPESTVKGQDYTVNFRFDSVEFVLDSTKNGDKITVTLDGLIQLANPTIEGKYTKNNGYRLVFIAAEKANLKIISAMKFSKEYKKLLWGTEIKIEDLGRCDLGLFLLIKANGEIRLVAEVNQAFSMALGVHGSTTYYFPGSVRHIADFDQFCETKVDIYTKMTIFAGLRCTAKLKVKSYDVLNMYVDGGAEATVETENNTLSADVGLRTKSGGKVFSYKFTLFDKYYSLWKYKTPDMAGYEMVIHEACAFGDFVAGEIHRKTTSGTVPYKGDLKVVLQKTDNSVTEFTAETGDSGIFIARDIPLVKGDKVRIKLPGVANMSSAVSATIPFHEIILYAADYYDGSAFGSVAGSKSEWYKMASKQNTGSSVNAAILGRNMPNAARKVSTVSQSEILKKINEFKNNLLTYKGQVEFITRDKFRKAVLPAQQLNQPASGNVRHTAEPLKIHINKGFINSPFGTFDIKGLQFKPNQEVKARIELEGFVIESDWVETEGLMISGIEHTEFETSRGVSGETFGAQNSFVIISPIRSEKVPDGVVRILKGFDVPHASLRTVKKINEFPEAQKAVIFFDVNATLNPLGENSGSAIAMTNGWKISVPYLVPSEALNFNKNGKHPFELVSYKYKEEKTGYKLFVDECNICQKGSFNNTINNLQKQKPGALMRPEAVKPLQVPVKQPITGGARIR